MHVLKLGSICYYPDDRKQTWKTDTLHCTTVTHLYSVHFDDQLIFILLFSTLYL